MRFDKTVKKVLGFGNPHTVDVNAAKEASKKRALEQRDIVIDLMEQRMFLEIDPQSKRFADFYGQTDAPAAIMPSNLTTKGSFATTQTNYDDAATVAAGATVMTATGSPGLNTIQTNTIASGGLSSQATPFDATNNAEFVLAESTIGVGTDYFFDKPTFARGDIYSTRISGYLRFTNEFGAVPAVNTGFFNNGMMRLKVITPSQEGKVSDVIWECSTEKFNAPAQAFIQAAGQPFSPHHLNYMLYPNFEVPKVVREGSTLQLTITGIFENQFVATDGGAVVDLAAMAGCYIDGSRSQFNIATHRIEYFQGGTVPMS